MTLTVKVSGAVEASKDADRQEGQKLLRLAE